LGLQNKGLGAQHLFYLAIFILGVYKISQGEPFIYKESQALLETLL
jgi:hypothetical protein